MSEEVQNGPGIQALNNRFQNLTHTEQVLHFIALLMVMAPAACHRIAERGMVLRHFVELASRFLEFAMLPLMLSIAVDLFLLARFILDNSTLSAVVALASDLPARLREEIEQFFLSTTFFTAKKPKILDWKGLKRASSIIKESNKAFLLQETS